MKTENIVERASQQLYDLDGTLILTDHGRLKNPEIQHYQFSIGRDIIYPFDRGYYYEVHRDVARNNFIITVHPNTGQTKVPYAEFSKYGFHEVVHNVDPDPYEYVMNALNRNYSTIVYWFQNDGDRSSYYDIYYDAWDIGNKDANDPNASYAGCDDFTYLKSRMLATKLTDCYYIYRDIRKKKVYPSAFLWERFDPVNYEKVVEHEGIPDLIKQCDEEQLNRKSIADAVELYRTGKYTLDQLSAKTNWKKWEIHRALTKNNNNTVSILPPSTGGRMLYIGVSHIRV